MDAAALNIDERMPDLSATGRAPERPGECARDGGGVEQHPIRRDRQERSSSTIKLL
jgi:hypothetical protein